jgi:hypothetical protein
MDQNVVNYLQQNKGAYSREALIEELKKAGHTENNISEAVRSVFGGGIDLSSNSGVINFWDFKTKIVYQNSSQKWKDFLFGFFAPFLGIFLALIPPVSLAFGALEIFSLFYLFNRRRFIVLGLLSSFVCGFLFAISMAFLLGGGHF